MSGAAMG